MSKYLVRVMKNDRYKDHPANNMAEARSICRNHLGVSRLTESMSGGMNYNALDEQGWTELQSWFLDDGEISSGAAIYTRL